IVEPKIAVPRKSNPKFVMRTKKIFLGGLSASTSLEDIKSYFEQFCTVKDAMLALTKSHTGIEASDSLPLKTKTSWIRFAKYTFMILTVRPSN
ncbi:RNAbinding protein Musashi -like protein Rbp6like, partial [Caligus rogercresseyi]